MRTISTRAHWKTANERRAWSWGLRPDGTCRGAERPCFHALVYALAVTAALFLRTAHSLSLNDAVNAQLANNCSLLLGQDRPQAVLTDGLRDICTRSGPSPTAGGGNSATPVTLPSIVRERMEKKYGKDSKDRAGRDGSVYYAQRQDVMSDAAVVTLGTGLNAFASIEYQQLDRQVTDFEDGYDSDISRITLGVDKQLTQRTSAGLAFDGYKQDGNFDGGGNFDVWSYGLIAFGSWLPTDSTFLQAYGQYAYQPNDRTRVATLVQEGFNDVTGRPDADFDANQFGGGVLLGYDYSIDNVTIGPRAGFDAVYTDFESYDEKNDNSGLSLGFRSDSKTSLQSNLGLQGSVAVSTGLGVVVAQGGFSWKHEFADDQRNADVYFVDDIRKQNFTYETDRPDRDFFEYNIGLLLSLPRDVQTFVNYRVLNGHSYFDSQTITVGFRVDL